MSLSRWKGRKSCFCKPSLKRVCHSCKSLGRAWQRYERDHYITATAATQAAPPPRVTAQDQHCQQQTPPPHNNSNNRNSVGITSLLCARTCVLQTLCCLIITTFFEASINPPFFMWENLRPERWRSLSCLVAVLNPGSKASARKQSEPSPSPRMCWEVKMRDCISWG